MINLGAIVLGITSIIAVIALCVSFWLADRVNELTKRFDDHGHNTSIHGGTTCRPTDQNVVSFEQLVAAIRGLQNQGALDAKAMKGLIDAASKSKSKS